MATGAERARTSRERRLAADPVQFKADERARKRDFYRRTHVPKLPTRACANCAELMSDRGIYCSAPECVLARNRDRMREYMRERRASLGRDLYPARECVGCGKTWNPTSPDIFCCSRACTNVMRYGSGSEHKLGRHTVSPATRLRIYERDNWTCYLCGFPVDRMAVVPDLEAPTLDHVVPLRSGGSNEVENLKTAHFHCNCVKGAKPLALVA